MALLKNLPFSGSPIYDVDPGVQTFKRTMANAQGDMAGLLAVSTDNAETDHANHSGDGRGALIGNHWVNQCMGLGLGLDTGVAKNGGVVAGDAYNFFWFVRVEPGETKVLVEATFSNLLDGFRPRASLSLTTNIATAVGADLDLELTGDTGAGQSTLSCLFTGCAAGLALLTIALDCTRDSGGTVLLDSTELVDVVVRKNRAGVVKIAATRNTSNPVPVVEPTATQALFFQQMDSAVLSLPFGEQALTGWHTSRIDRNINAVVEFLTGSPAGTNATYTHTESALIDPTRDRFKAFTRKTFATEPIPIIPIVSVCLGGIKDDGGYLVDPASGPSVAARRAFAPYASSAGVATLARVGCRMPDIPDGVSSVLRFAVLVGQSSGIGFANIRAQAQTGSETASALTAPTAITGAAHLALLTGTALDMRRDQRDELIVQMSQVAGIFSSLDYCLLSAAVWVEP